MTSETLIHVKASPIRLAPDASSEEAFIAIIGACLRHAEANQSAVEQGQIEGVHQMRVAFRRLRSGLKLFRSLIPREASADRVADLRWLNGFLGPARDWDVFLEEGMAPLFARFPRKRSLSLLRRAAEQLRQRHHETLREALAQPAYARMMTGFADGLERRAWRAGLDEERQALLAEPALDFATPWLERQHRRVEKRGQAFAELSAEQRHALRIRIKELRYALDFFASLYPSAAVKMTLSALADLQDGLGVMNDITVARRLLDEAGLKPLSAARQLIEGWYGCRLEFHERQFAEVWQRYQDSERPWKD